MHKQTDQFPLLGVLTKQDQVPIPVLGFLRQHPAGVDLVSNGKAFLTTKVHKSQLAGIYLYASTLTYRIFEQLLLSDACSDIQFNLLPPFVIV